MKIIEKFKSLKEWQKGMFITIPVVILLAYAGSQTESVSPEERKAFREQEKAKKERAEFEKQLMNSEWDGSVFAVKWYLQNTLNDWDSYEGMEWSPVQMSQDSVYLVRHKYRAANAFGAKIIVEQLFTYNNKGEITNVITY